MYVIAYVYIYIHIPRTLNDPCFAWKRFLFQGLTFKIEVMKGIHIYICIYIPKGSMYGIFTYIYHKFEPNVKVNIPYMDPLVFIYIYSKPCKGVKTCFVPRFLGNLWWDRTPPGFDGHCTVCRWRSCTPCARDERPHMQRREKNWWVVSMIILFLSLQGRPPDPDITWVKSLL